MATEWKPSLIQFGQDRECQNDRENGKGRTERGSTEGRKPEYGQDKKQSAVNELVKFQK